MMGTQIELRTHRFWLFLIQAATLGAVLATVFSALSFTAPGLLVANTTRLPAFKSAPTLWDVAQATGLMCVITVVWYGPFGFLAGAIGGTLLHLRRPKIHSLKRLLTESAAFGVFVAVLVPFYDAAGAVLLRHFAGGYSFAQLIAIVPSCVASSAICALALCKRVIQRTDSV